VAVLHYTAGDEIEFAAIWNELVPAMVWMGGLFLEVLDVK
jgi:hypothetical protein